VLYLKNGLKKIKIYISLIDDEGCSSIEKKRSSLASESAINTFKQRSLTSVEVFGAQIWNFIRPKKSFGPMRAF
jgi:hypothetical protein